MIELLRSELTVLIVEPSATQRRIIHGALARAGITGIHESASGAGALVAAREARPALVLSALHLPDMDAARLVQALHADPLLERMAFVLVSSETRLSELDPIRAAGAAAILGKPFTDHELDLALNVTLELLDPHHFDLPECDPELLSVLIVDDMRTARRHIRRVLESMGFERFTEASNGREALELVSRQCFDLLVTDYNMPEMDGYVLLEEIREHSTQSSIPVLMVTSEHDQRRLAALERAGVSAICDKPFEPATVRSIMRQLLGAGA